MSVNSSTCCNASSSSSSSDNMYYFLQKCWKSRTGAISVTSFTIISLLTLLPLCLYVLYLGARRWRRQRSNMAVSHCDVFTFHMAVSEMIGILGSSLICCGAYVGLPHMMVAGIYLSANTMSARTCFHIQTVVERYLAVVQPVTYLSLRKAKGIRIRNISIGCVWLQSIFGPLVLLQSDQFLTAVVCNLFSVFLLAVVSFCSLSVLCVLIRPGPGEGGGARERVDQSKLRAFYTIMAILGVLLFMVAGDIMSTFLYYSTQMNKMDTCDLWLTVTWFYLPSSLVLPLLFLQRAGRLVCCKNTKESGLG